MELTRGTIAERPWALTIAMFARRGASGQLTLVSPDRKRYSIAFERGLIAAARSPAIADSIRRIALTSHLASTSQVADAQREVEAHPGRDEVEVLTRIAQLSPAQVQRLRCDALIRQAARTFAVEIGEYVFEEPSCLPSHDCAVDYRAVLYYGVRMHLSEQRLASELRQLGGAQFVLEDAAVLHHFGFSETEWPIVTALRDGTSLAELEVRYRELDPRMMRSAIYALVISGAARVVVVTRAATPITLPRTKTKPELAAEAAERARRALQNEQPQAAVRELETAVALVPNDIDYSALLGWALFCASEEKSAIAGVTRRVLERAVKESQRPELARFYRRMLDEQLSRN